jgi:hypothetical protein
MSNNGEEEEVKSMYYGVTSSVYEYLKDSDSPASPYFEGVESNYVSAEEELKGQFSGEKVKNDSAWLNSVFDEMMDCEIDPLEAQMHTAHKNCSFRKYSIDEEDANAIALLGFDSYQLKLLSIEYEKKRESSQLWLHVSEEEFATSKDNILKFDDFAFKIISQEVIIYFHKLQDFEAMMNTLLRFKDSCIRLGFVSFQSNLNFRDAIKQMCQVLNRKMKSSALFKLQNLEESVKHSINSIASSTENRIAEEFMSAFQKLNALDAQTYLQLSSVFEAFCTLLKIYGRVIITEYSLDQSEKTIKSVDVGGVAGGEKFLIK